jgi:hypothetical protein
MRDIVPLFKAVEDALLAALDDESLHEANDPRTLKALELIGEAAQCLYAACVNLELCDSCDSSVACTDFLLHASCDSAIFRKLTTWLLPKLS